MKGVVLLFLVIAPSLILWGYTDKVTRNWVKQVVRKNLFALTAATVIVAVLLFNALNITLKLV